jgi:hypothetical protein
MVFRSNWYVAECSLSWRGGIGHCWRKGGVVGGG